MACTMPGFPDKYMPFMDEDAYGKLSANMLKFTYGPLVRWGRKRNLRTKYDVEPAWRTRGTRVEDRLHVALGGLCPAGVLGVMAD